jgi:L-iditol 2-dehydrogenase
MKTLFCTSPKTMEVQEAAEPVISSPTGVIVRVKRVGICGSDGGRWEWTNALLQQPHIGGHEYAGVVEAIGPGVTSAFPNLRVGTRVAGMPIDHCSSCDLCRSGLSQHCAKRRVMGAHPTWPGAFAELVLSDAKLLVPIPDDLSFDKACTTEPAACSTWVGDRCEFFCGGSLKGKNGLIAGGGPIGFFALQDVIARGAGKVVVTDADPNRLKSIAAAGGIPLQVGPGVDVVAEVTKLLGGLADFSADCVGFTETRDQCGFATKPYHPSAWCGLHVDGPSPVAAGQYIRRGVVTVGVFAYTPEAYKLAGERLRSGQMGLPDGDVVYCGFEEGQKWFTRLFADKTPGKPAKVILDPSL